jgi:isocitrate lyase
MTTHATPRSNDAGSLFFDADPPRRWDGVVRTWQPSDALRLRPSVPVRHTIAEVGADRLWRLLHDGAPVTALGAVTGNQAVQMVRAGLPAVYVSGWQVAADANLSGNTYPDQSLYPSNSVPNLVRRINSALLRADQIERAEGAAPRAWLAPIVADGEAGFGGPLHAFELTRQLIEAGAAAVHFEDQLASEKKCGHMGGKVLVPTQQFLRTLSAARLAADVCGVRTLIIARTDADAATLLTSDVDPRDQPFLTGERTAEGYFRVRPGVDAALSRALSYAPYADLLWCETSTPDLAAARRFAEGVHARFPGKLLAYNCSPSFNWKRHLDDGAIARFQRELASMGYRFQFVTLAGFHSLNYGMYALARDFAVRGMTAYAELQAAELGAEAQGYTAGRHQREVGAGWFDAVSMVLSGGAEVSTLALEGSTELGQFGAGRRVDGRSKEARAMRAAQQRAALAMGARGPSGSANQPEAAAMATSAAGRSRATPLDATPQAAARGRGARNGARSDAPETTRALGPSANRDPSKVDAEALGGHATRPRGPKGSTVPAVTRVDGRTREGRALRQAALAGDLAAVEALGGARSRGTVGDARIDGRTREGRAARAALRARETDKGDAKPTRRGRTADAAPIDPPKPKGGRARAKG